MTKESNIKEQLLNQMDKNFDQASAKSTQEIIARDTARVKRMKWMTIFSWLALVVFFIVAGVIERNPSYRNTVWLNCAIIILRGLLLIAVIFTVSLYVRSRTLTLHKIQTRLANIEEQLKRMSQVK
ncbi:MAG: hypothetical protein ACE5NM_05785 [Sedimentisphaerales bacterium]